MWRIVVAEVYESIEGTFIDRVKLRRERRRKRKIVKVTVTILSSVSCSNIPTIIVISDNRIRRKERELPYANRIHQRPVTSNTTD